MDTLLNEAPVEVQRNEDGTLSFTGDLFGSGLSPEQARELAAQLLDQADAAAELHERRKKTDAVRALLNVLDANPDLPLMPIDISDGEMGRCYNQGEFDNAYRTLIRLGPVEVTHRVMVNSNCAYHVATVTLPSGARLHAEQYDSSPEGVEAARSALAALEVAEQPAVEVTA